MMATRRANRQCAGVGGKIPAGSARTPSPTILTYGKGDEIWIAGTNGAMWKATVVRTRQRGRGTAELQYKWLGYTTAGKNNWIPMGDAAGKARRVRRRSGRVHGELAAPRRTPTSRCTSTWQRSCPRRSTCRRSCRRRASAATRAWSRGTSMCGRITCSASSLTRHAQRTTGKLVASATSSSLRPDETTAVVLLTPLAFSRRGPRSEAFKINLSVKAGFCAVAGRLGGRDPDVRAFRPDDSVRACQRSEKTHWKPRSRRAPCQNVSAGRSCHAR